MQSGWEEAREEGWLPELHHGQGGGAVLGLRGPGWETQLLRGTGLSFLQSFLQKVSAELVYWSSFVELVL